MTYKEALEKIKECGLNIEELLHSEVMELVCEALENQIPKFVKCPKGFQGIRDTRFYCPACNALTRQREDFCHKCGQAVKYPKEVIDREQHKIYLNWSDTE